MLPEKSKPIKSEEASLQVYESTLILRHFWPAMAYETQYGKASSSLTGLSDGYAGASGQPRRV